MSRRKLRMLLAVALGGSAIAFAFVIGAVLMPAREPAAEVFLVTESAVEAQPTFLSSPPLRDLAVLARHERFGSGPVPAPVPGRPDPRGLYIVRDEDGRIRAFLAADPRNGCSLEWIQELTLPWASVRERFHDMCHGSFYDRNGRVTAGPSPWPLDEARLVIRNGSVFAVRGEVQVVTCIQCPGYARP